MPFREDAGDRDTVSTGCHQHLEFKKSMAIASLNINGLRSHHNEIKLLLTLFWLGGAKLPPLVDFFE